MSAVDPERFHNEPYVTLEGVDYGTRLGRVQAAWWIADHGGHNFIVTPDERTAHEGALAGDDMTEEDTADLEKFVNRILAAEREEHEEHEDA